MSGLAFSFSVLSTFPGVVSKELPTIFAYPSIGISTKFGNYTYGGFEIGGLKYAVGGENITILNSSLGFGSYIRNWNVFLGFMATTAGIGRLNIDDQSYTALLFRGGYRLRFFEFGLNLPVYLLSQEDRFGVLPVPFIYASFKLGNP